MKPQRPPSTFLIRPAQLKDLDAIAALENAAFESDRLSRRTLRNHIDAAHRPVFTAWIGELLAGYALIALRKGSRRGRLYSIAVDNRAARRGVAKALIQAAERYLRRHKREALRLEVRADNAAAIALYESLGYALFGRYIAYYEDGTDALRLEKRLAPN